MNEIELYAGSVLDHGVSFDDCLAENIPGLCALTVVVFKAVVCVIKTEGLALEKFSLGKNELAFAVSLSARF